MSKVSNCWFPGWLKELAHWVEVIDGHYFEENRYIHNELVRIARAILEVEVDEPHPCEEPTYEPKTYDEAIALCKDWERCVDESCFICWKTPKGVWPPTTYSNVVPFSWERDKWPELWKEMVKDRYPGHLGFCKDEWIFKALVRHRDSTPGRAVCQAYLYYRNHHDWAERLSKTEDDCD